ncbi:MAG TPA: hypothetical protein VM695_11235 [Phycisphaerae bacterium]|nr:hypothetical protein [Phycisphaerae bacterium]
MIALWALAAVCLALSLLADRGRTSAALKLAAVRLAKILPAFLLMLVLFAVGITLVPQEAVRRLLGQDSGALGVAVAAALGSVTLMPGFIAFPLCGALLKEGVPYMVLAAFTTTLMMVGVLTYPLERQYFGRNVALIRNAVSLLIALVVAVVVGVVFGEIRP